MNSRYADCEDYNSNAVRPFLEIIKDRSDLSSFREAVKDVEGVAYDKVASKSDKKHQSFSGRIKNALSGNLDYYDAVGDAPGVMDIATLDEGDRKKVGDKLVDFAHRKGSKIHDRALAMVMLGRAMATGDANVYEQVRDSVLKGHDKLIEDMAAPYDRLMKELGGVKAASSAKPDLSATVEHQIGKAVEDLDNPRREEHLANIINRMASTVHQNCIHADPEQLKKAREQAKAEGDKAVLMGPEKDLRQAILAADMLAVGDLLEDNPRLPLNSTHNFVADVLRPYASGKKVSRDVEEATPVLLRDLRSHGATMDVEGDPALPKMVNYALKNDRSRVVPALLALGANPTLPDGSGKSFMDHVKEAPPDEVPHTLKFMQSWQDLQTVMPSQTPEALARAESMTIRTFGEKGHVGQTQDETVDMIDMQP